MKTLLIAWIVGALFTIAIELPQKDFHRQITDKTGYSLKKILAVMTIICLFAWPLALWEEAKVVVSYLKLRLYRRRLLRKHPELNYFIKIRAFLDKTKQQHP